MKAVHCRAGSLETFRAGQVGSDSVHCRTGSLENGHQHITDPARS